MTAIIEEVLQQCDRNDAQWGGHGHDDTHSVEDWCGFIEHQMNQIRTHGRGTPRKRMIKVAALAIQAVESYDRKNPCTT